MSNANAPQTASQPSQDEGPGPMGCSIILLCAAIATVGFGWLLKVLGLTGVAALSLWLISWLVPCAAFLMTIGIIDDECRKPRTITSKAKSALPFWKCGVTLLCLVSSVWLTRYAAQPPSYSGLRGVLSGKWERKNEYHSAFLNFSSESSVFLKDYGEEDLGKYEVKDDVLTFINDRGNHNTYHLEFLSDGELTLLPQSVVLGHDFCGLGGRWQRISMPFEQRPSPKTLDSPPPDAPAEAVDALADARRQVERIEHKHITLESVLQSALEDRDELTARLRAVGVNSSADLKGNIRGMRLAQNLVKLGTEIDGLENHLAVMDAELLNAKTIVRRIEREQAGLSETELRNLTQQLREAEERTDGIPQPTTPLDVDAAVERALNRSKDFQAR